MASRAEVAAYVADRLTKDREAALNAAASWLVDTGRTRQAGYLAKDVAQVLAGKGYVHARVTSARPLSQEARREIEEFIKQESNAKELELELAVEPGVIGGVRIEFPGAELDGTVRTKLAKFVEGVSR